MRSHVSLICVEEPGLRAPARGRLGDGSVHVAPVLAVDPELLKPVLETRVADRGRTHVDTAAARAEIERSADDGRLSPLAVGHGP